MEGENSWFWTGVALWAISWFLPAAGLGAGGVELGSISGFRAFRLTWEASWEGHRASGDVAFRELSQQRQAHPGSPSDRFLPWTWALNLAIPIAVLLRKIAPVMLWVALFGCALMAFWWWVKLPSEALRVGYYAWVGSFVLTGVGVLRSRETA